METVHNFACVHQQEGSLKMKRQYDMCIVASTFGSRYLVWLYKFSPNKEGHLTKIETAMGGAIHCCGMS